MIAYQLLALAIGVVSCCGFWLILLQLRPKLQFCSTVAFNDSKGTLGFKIANFGSRQVLDVAVKVGVLHRSPQGKLVTLKAGQLRANLVPAFDPADKMDVPWCLPTSYVFVCENGLELLRYLRAECPDGEHRLAFTVAGRDALSGTSSVHRLTYRADQVVSGWFERGLKFTISVAALSTSSDEVPCGISEATDVAAIV